MMGFVVIIVVLIGIIMFLSYRLYSYSKRPRIDLITSRSGESIESKISDLRANVTKLRERLKYRECLFEKAFKDDMDG